MNLKESNSVFDFLCFTFREFINCLYGSQCHEWKSYPQKCFVIFGFS